jgi:hypothetical protein
MTIGSISRCWKDMRFCDGGREEVCKQRSGVEPGDVSHHHHEEWTRQQWQEHGHLLTWTCGQLHRVAHQCHPSGVVLGLILHHRLLLDLHPGNTARESTSCSSCQPPSWPDCANNVSNLVLNGAFNNDSNNWYWRHIKIIIKINMSSRATRLRFRPLVLALPVCSSVHWCLRLWPSRQSPGRRRPPPVYRTAQVAAELFIREREREKDGVVVGASGSVGRWRILVKLPPDTKGTLMHISIGYVGGFIKY